MHGAPCWWHAEAIRTLFGCYERGFLTRLQLSAADVVPLFRLRRLLASEPLLNVTFTTGRVGELELKAVRHLLPLAYYFNLTISPGVAGEFLASLLSSPVMTTATTLRLDGVNYGRTAAVLVGWLAKSPFLGEVRNLNLARNRFDCADARQLASLPNLPNVQYLNVTENLIGTDGLAALHERFGEAVLA